LDAPHQVVQGIIVQSVEIVQQLSAGVAKSFQISALGLRRIEVRGSAPPAKVFGMGSGVGLGGHVCLLGRR
jgi:hypothetical protein